MTTRSVSRVVAATLAGVVIGLVVGYIPSALVYLPVAIATQGTISQTGGWAEAGTLGGVVWLACAGLIVGFLQQRALPPSARSVWWVVALGAIWAASHIIDIVRRGRPGDVDLAAILPALVLISVGTGVFALWRSGRGPRQRGPRAMHTNTDPGPPSAPLGPVATGFRTGLFAAPMYLLFVGAGHIWLFQVMTSQFDKVPREGQAFMELGLFGALAIGLGVIALPIAAGLSRERGVPLLRAAVVALVVAGAVVAYTFSRGVERGGVVGVPLPCIVEQGRQVCPQGDGTYVRGSRLDPPVMFLGTVFAYAAAHVLGRRRPDAAVR